MRQRLLLKSDLLGTILVLCLLLVGTTLLAQWTYSVHRSAAFEMGAPPGLLPAAGLNDIESFPDHSGRYRWTNGNGVVRLPNPGGAVELRLLMAAGPNRTVPITMTTDTNALHFSVGPNARRYALLLPAGANDRLPLRIYSPVLAEDERTLGVLISDIRLNGGGSVPRGVLWALLVAVAGVYTLLRKAKLGISLTVGISIILVSLTLAWQNYEGWRYGITETLLLGIGVASLVASVMNDWLPLYMPHEQPAPQLKRTDWYAITIVLTLAMCSRLPWLVARDPVGDIELSARQMNLLLYEGLAGAYRFGNDYMPLRLYILRGLSLIAPLVGAHLDDPMPVATLIVLKLPGLLADLATITLIYLWARRWRAVPGAALIALLYALTPPVWINVAWWGQVDAWLMLPLLSAVLLLNRAGGRWSWVCWAVALLIKPQAIIITPLLYAVTLRRYGCRGLAQGGALAGGLLLLGCIPIALAQGGAGGIVQAYVGSVERFPLLTNRAFNVWYLVTLGKNSFDVGQGIGAVSYRLIGLLLTGGIALLVGATLLRRADAATRLHGAAVLALAFFLLPTQIHERYLFLALAFLVLRIASDIRVLIPYLILAATGTLNIFGTLGGFSPRLYRIIAPSPLPLIAAGINLVVLLYLVYLLTTLIQHSKQSTVIHTYQTGIQATALGGDEPEPVPHR